VSIGTLLAFVIVCASVLILRIKKPEIHRPFKTPWMPFVPLMGVAICLAQMVALPFDTWIRLIAWMAIGLAVYFLFGYRHSRLSDVK
ncbi:MAG: amino acid permease C-terminal domain-containing protein, partial [Mangrovibacterium sp.]|nr:amino acid permease C-terminal domain-containing protein [Mangrovibacterium sp.]